MEELKQFVTQFFASQSSPIIVDGEQFTVLLAEPLSRYFGVEQLKLVFNPHHLTEETQLVTHGSFVLNKLAEYLAEHGVGAHIELPIRPDTLDRPPSELIFRNMLIHQTRRSRSRALARYAFVFNFKIDYISDEKVGRLHALGLDAEGRWWQPPLDFTPAQAENPQVPSAELHAAYDAAQKLIEEHVRRESVQIEKDILQRLYRQINRLDIFYTEQIDSLRQRQTARAPHEIQEQIDRLQQEYQLKATEETENHRLRIKIQLVNYRIWRIPYQSYQLTLRSLQANNDETPAHAIDFTFYRNLNDGRLEPVHCSVCRRETHMITVCRNDHLTCEDHAHECVDCGEWECDACGVGVCGECGATVCSSCSQKCRVCQKPLCRSHRLNCHISQETICQSCSIMCKECGQVTGLHHQEKCATCHQPTCAGCLQECSFCYAHTCREHTRKCEICGQIFCDNCVRACAVTGRLVCRSHSWECQSCGKSFSVEVRDQHGSKCTVSHREICIDCQKICDICGNTVSPAYSIYCEPCGKTYCRRDAKVCYESKKVICPIHHHICQSCSHPVSEDCITACRICEETYCAGCVDKKGRCRFCQQLRFVQPVHTLPPAIIAADLPSDVKKCADWRFVEAGLRQIYFGVAHQDVYIIVFDKDRRLIRSRKENFAKIMQIMMNYAVAPQQADQST